MRKIVTFILIIALSSPLFARAGGRYSSSSKSHSYSSMGSKGSQTYRPATSTAQPISKSSTQPHQNPTHNSMPQSKPSFFQQHPILTGLASGFIGSWIFNQFFGDHAAHQDANTTQQESAESESDWMGTLFDMLAVGLIAFGGLMLFRRWKEKQNPAPATNETTPSPSFDTSAIKENPFKAVYGNTSSSATTISNDEATNLFLEVQKGWSSGDMNALRFVATPEMVTYFSDALTENISQGVINTLTDVQVQSVQNVETWSEGTLSYSSVKIDFTMVDQTLNRQGECVAGSTTPTNGEEIWTFVTSANGNWVLSAIEQV